MRVSERSLPENAIQWGLPLILRSRQGGALAVNSPAGLGNIRSRITLNRVFRAWRIDENANHYDPATKKLIKLDSKADSFSMTGMLEQIRFIQGHIRLPRSSFCIPQR
jgi:hypothetical protein